MSPTLDPEIVAPGPHGLLPVRLDLRAVIMTVHDDQPRVLVAGGPDGGCGAGLPAGDLDPGRDETIELAMRRIVGERTSAELAYLEQLYTFGDLGRSDGERLLTVAYLALTRDPRHTGPLRWVDAYDVFPWEDHREGAPAVLEVLEPFLRSWVGDDAGRAERAGTTFALDGSPWDPARVLERYELLYEVALAGDDPLGLRHPDQAGPLMGDDRRIVATALGRLRGKLTWRPVVFELLPPTFTLRALQRCVEALAGRRVHTSNFRRLVETTGLVERVGARVAGGPGRPAELHRFRREVLRERPAPGVGLRPGRR